jgi:hypothetical protein
VLIVMFRRSRLCFALTGLLTALALLSGCGSKVPRQPLSGTVSGVGSRPGTVTFQPVEGVHAPAARAPLRNGRFEFDETDGPLPGTYRVRVDLQKPRRLTGGTVTVKGVEVPESAVGEVPPEMESFFVEDVRVAASGRPEQSLTVETSN